MAFTRAQRKSLLIGFGLILAAAGTVALIWLGSYLPGIVGDVFSVIAGVMWTPILLDFTIFLFGMSLVLWLNWFIRARDGDEYVYLEQLEGPGIPDDLPLRARSAIFRDEPEPQGLRPALAAIEGAIELADFAEATELLFELPSEQLDTPEVLALRIQLATRQGHEAKARELLAKLCLKSPHHPLCPVQEAPGP